MVYRPYDTILLAPAIVAAISLGVLYMSDKHILPQTSTTFSMKAVRSYKQGDADDGIFDTKTAFEGHKFYTTGKMQAVTAAKYTRGCYGSWNMVNFADSLQAATATGTAPDGDREWDYFNTLNSYQRESGGNNRASVCRCIDEYADRAFNITQKEVANAWKGSKLAVTAAESAETAAPANSEAKVLATTAKYDAITNKAEMAWRKTYWAWAADTHGNTEPDARNDNVLTAYEQFFQTKQTYETFPGNYMYNMPTTEYTHLAEIAEWCDQTALPQYTLEFQSVIYSKGLLLVGLALVLAGLDVLGQRSGEEIPESEDKGSLQTMMVFVFEVLPVWLLAGSFVYYQFTGHIKDSAADDQTNNTTYLMVVIYILIFVSASVLLIISISNVFADKKQASKVPQKMTQRIYTDVPMIAGLALVGVALKLQNGEHDEVILLTTLVVLVSAGLVQHLSNLVRIMYEKVCGLLSNEVIVALQSADERVTGADKEHLDKTRRIMQYFGWTRLYGFGVVLVLVLVTVTMSSSVVATNPIQAFTQNQYYYFAFAFVVAWTGLDFIYEILPFTSNSVEDYSEQTVDRMRKLSVLFYVVFVMISQYTLEAGEF